MLQKNQDFLEALARAKKIENSTVWNGVKQSKIWANPKWPIQLTSIAFVATLVA